MNSWEQIQQTVEYIEEHLSEDIRMSELAQIASLSPFYFQRLFTKLVKKPVAEYVRLRRMARALELLHDTDKRILDIAVELGFSSHEHFARVFKETFRMTPDEYRKNPVRMNFMTKPEIALQYVVIDEGVPLITEGIVLEINRKRLNKPEYFIGCQGDFPFEMLNGFGTESGEDGLDYLWNTIHAKKNQILQIDVSGDELGVTLQSSKEGHFTYFAGAAVTNMTKVSEIDAENEGSLPEGFTTYVLPEGDYVVCKLEAENFEALVMDALYKANKYLYEIWLQKHELTTEAFCAERYERHDPDATSMELWLKIV